MPSWNIHTAHVERLFADAGASSLGIRDTNAFLFGNLAPDIYVGYMVPDVSRKIDYKDTHYADPGFIPAPDAARFYREFIEGREADDLVLGAWCHLLADHYYNLRTIEYIDAIGVKAGEQTRIRKQGDFDVFGRTLKISIVPTLTPELIRLGAQFPQYAIDEPDVRASVVVAEGIVSRNRKEHVKGTPTYSLLTPEFFESTFDEVNRVLFEGLRLHAAGEDPTHLGRA